MANWCEGCIKIRGEFENVKRFFVEGTTCYKFDFDKKENIPDTESVKIIADDNNEFCRKYHGETHINGTRRAFLRGWVEIYRLKRNKKVTAALWFKQAWAIDADSFVEISKKYNVDIKILGFDMGMRFSQEVVVIQGELIKDKEKKYRSWDWDCPFPFLGG